MKVPSKTNPKIVAIIQARMSSSRLPGKVLKEAGGRPLLERMVERVNEAKLINETLVATTVDSSDDQLAEFCEARNIPFFRGNLLDVLDRYYQAAVLTGAEVIVRLTGDCPFIDPDLIDKTIQALLDKRADFACDRLPPPLKRTYPIGWMWRYAHSTRWREPGKRPKRKMSGNT
jgi:spore coat polysaccharide biosynthesis protein SpsF